MATYKQIRADVQERYGLFVQNCWIAHVKELHGLTFRRAHNRQYAERPLTPCPAHVLPLIEDSLRRFDMLVVDCP